MADPLRGEPKKTRPIINFGRYENSASESAYSRAYLGKMSII
jgi:hypothetical protein